MKKAFLGNRLLLHIRRLICSGASTDIEEAGIALVAVGAETETSVWNALLDEAAVLLVRIDGARFRLRTDPKFSAAIQCMEKKEDCFLVCLVRVVTLVSVPTVPVYIIDAAGNHTINTARPPRHPDSMEVYVHLLLSMPQHTVLDICISTDCEKKCAIDVTGEYMVRFVTSDASDVGANADRVDIEV